MGTRRVKKGILLLCAVLAAMLCLMPGTALADEGYTPLEVTGFSCDVVADVTMTGAAREHSVTGTIDLNNEGGNNAFFTGGDNPGRLPDNGTITTASGIQLQLQPYNAFNALQLWEFKSKGGDMSAK